MYIYGIKLYLLQGKLSLIVLCCNEIIITLFYHTKVKYNTILYYCKMFIKI